MLRFSLRTLGFLMMAGAFANLVVDGSRSIAGGRALFFSLGEVLAWLAGAPFAAAVATVEAWPPPARGLAAGLLAVPGWLAAAAVGLGLLYAGRRRAAKVGFSGRRT